MKPVIVIKLGGNAITQLSDAFFNQLKAWQQGGYALLLVHGGGPQISAWSAKFGLHPQKKAGIRITDAQTLKVTQAVLLGLVQPALCQKLCQAGLSALGLNTADQNLLIGDYLDQAQYGEVGKITQVNAGLLHQLLDQQIGVLAPLAQTKGGQMLNVNADMAAASIAKCVHAEKLVLLTDVPGVLKQGQVLKALTTAQVDELISTNVIQSGMQPKVQAASACAKAGAAVVITDDLSHAGTTVLAAM